MKNIGFDDWAPDQEVEYKLIATVNGQVAYSVTTADPDIISNGVRLAEEQVAILLNDQYIDDDLDYDAMAEDMRMREAGEI